MAAMFGVFRDQYVDANGNPYSGAKAYFYDVGTTTPKTVFSDNALTIPRTQPVVALSDGTWPETYFQNALYRIQIFTSADVLIDDVPTFDPGSPSAGAGVIPIAQGGTGATTAALARANLGLGPLSTASTAEDGKSFLGLDRAWADIASAGTTDIGATSSDNLRITGTTTITSLGTAASGVTRSVRFAAALTLTHNATSLILPSAANITTAANDTAIFKSLGSGNWHCIDYQRANGEPVVTPRLNWVQIGSAIATTSGSAWQFTDIPPDYSDLMVVFSGISSSLSATLAVRASTDAGGSPTWPSLHSHTGVNGTTAVTGYSQTSVVMSGSVGAAGAASGTILIPSYRTAMAVKSMQSMLIDNFNNTSHSREILFESSSSIKAVGLLLSAGVGDAGSITLWGR